MFGTRVWLLLLCTREPDYHRDVFLSGSAAGRVEEPDSSPAGSLGALDDGQIYAVDESDVTDLPVPHQIVFSNCHLKCRAATVAARTDTIHCGV